MNVGTKPKKLNCSYAWTNEFVVPEIIESGLKGQNIYSFFLNASGYAFV